jgi:hypothetical protein
VARHIFKLARCGYTLRVTSQTLYIHTVMTLFGYNTHVNTAVY